MTVKTLYRYLRVDGGITVSTEQPDCEYVETYRLIADEKKSLTKDGKHFTTCIDTDTLDGWNEVDAVADDKTESDTATDADYVEALESLGVKFDA